MEQINEFKSTFKKMLRRIEEAVGTVDTSTWLNIGVIKNGSPYGIGGDAYLMVDTHYPKSDNYSEFKYRATTFNTKPDGTGKIIDNMPTIQMRKLQIYPEYRDTYYGEAFLGKVDEKKIEDHKKFMSELYYDENGMVILTHNSNTLIKDGVIRKGVTNGYSNNSDFGIYFWGSEKIGRDQSNEGRYTYYCKVSPDEVYDFQNNLERFISLDEAAKKYKYVAQYWKDGAIVVNTLYATPIFKILDKTNGKQFDNQLNLIS